LIADEVFDPILFKIFGRHTVDLHPFSAKVIPLNRLVFFGETVSKDLLNTNKINSALAYPNQLTIPEKFWPSYRSFYPPCRGIDALVVGLEKMALNLGCKIIKGKKISAIETKEGAIHSLLIENERIQVDHLVSSIPVVQLGKLLGVLADAPNVDLPKHTVVTNLVFENDAVRDLNSRHYVYCYDPERTIFRITNYNALTNKSDGTVPLTVESVYAEFDEKEVTVDILRQLREMGIVSKAPLFSKTEMLSNGFPLPTIRNMDFLQDLREKMDGLNLHNFTRVGLLNEAGMFFMRDVLIDVEQKISSMCRK